MNIQQIISLAELCKGQPVSQVEQLISFYKEEQVAELANHFGCENTKKAVAECLSGAEATEQPCESEKSVCDCPAPVENEIVSEEIPEDLPEDGEETEENTDADTDTEESEEEDAPAEKPKTESKPKEEKLSVYEQAVLNEMKRRVEQGDEKLATAMQSKDKNIKDCFRYVTAQAKKKAVGSCAMIEDAEVYGWAHHYYIESKETIDKELAPKTKTPTATTTPAKKAEKKVKEAPKPPKNVLDITKAITAKTGTGKGKKEKKKDSLLAGFVPMERPETYAEYAKEAKKGSRQQAKSVETIDMFADFFATEGK